MATHTAAEEPPKCMRLLGTVSNGPDILPFICKERVPAPKLAQHCRDYHPGDTDPFTEDEARRARAAQASIEQWERVCARIGRSPRAPPLVLPSFDVLFDAIPEDRKTLPVIPVTPPTLLPLESLVAQNGVEALACCALLPGHPCMFSSCPSYRNLEEGEILE